VATLSTIGNHLLGAGDVIGEVMTGRMDTSVGQSLCVIRTCVQKATRSIERIAEAQERIALASEAIAAAQRRDP